MKKQAVRKSGERKKSGAVSGRKRLSQGEKVLEAAKKGSRKAVRRAQKAGVELVYEKDGVIYSEKPGQKPVAIKTIRKPKVSIPKKFTIG